MNSIEQLTDTSDQCTVVPHGRGAAGNFEAELSTAVPEGQIGRVTIFSLG